uniref:Uncharacterized protein n=1 Tax=Rhizophora mucronata TaxID=61149 RepID=A0A2P2PE35_RHIMU
MIFIPVRRDQTKSGQVKTFFSKPEPEYLMARY